MASVTFYVHTAEEDGNGNNIPPEKVRVRKISKRGARLLANFIYEEAAKIPVTVSLDDRSAKHLSMKNRTQYDADQHGVPASETADLGLAH